MAIGKRPQWETEENLIKLKGWARAGLTDEQIAKNIGINPCTLYEWKKKSVKISKALKKGKEVVDFEVENALCKRAKGYRYKEIIKELVKNEETGEKELTVVREVEKEMPPDVTAAIFWLKNRKPDVWRDRKNELVNSDKEETGVLLLPSVDGDNSVEGEINE